MAPMRPDLKRCRRKVCDVPPYASDLNFCPPYKGETPKMFEFPTCLPMRMRRAAHMVDDEYVHKYARAVHLMKSLPREDPRNFVQQANVHCAYCNRAYYIGDTEKLFKVHGNWLFLPWHRWFLYFHERILAKLLGDDTFALPFWNWDFEDGMTMPLMYMNKRLSLFDNKRNPDHAHGALVDLGFSYSEGFPEFFPDQFLVLKNYEIMHKQIVILGSSTQTFHGEPIRENSPKCTCGPGTLENAPHNSVHDWAGSVQTNNYKQGPSPDETDYGEDMGILYSAARDPLFYAHHANADRIWTIWKTLPGRNDYDDPDLLDTRFYFYDENACLVEVRAGDAFDPEKLCYKYQYSPTPWLELRRPLHGLLVDIPPNVDAVQTLNLQAKTFSQPVKIDVARNPPWSGPSVAFNELLVIEGIRVQRNITVKFDVFVQLDDCRVFTPYVDAVPPEYVGTYVELPRGPINDDECGCGQSSMRVVISEVLRSLGVGIETRRLKVTLIPKVNLQRPIQISAWRIE